MKKFILMDPEEVMALKASHDVNKQEYKIVNPRLNAMARLDNEIERKLDDTTKSDDEKAKSYVQAFQDFLTFKNQYIHGESQPTAAPQPTPGHRSEGISSGDIAKTVPKNLRSKAERLAELLKATGKVRWDESNRLIIDGKPVEGTNIIDLINDALRRRKTFMPHGRAEFADHLRAINAPKELVGNADYWKGAADASHSDDSSGNGSPPRTPAKTGRVLKSVRRSSGRVATQPRRRADWTKNRPSLEDVKWSQDINM